MVKLVDYEIDGNIGIIRLIDPDNFNPLSKESGRQLLEIIENLRDNDIVRALIISGTGKAFSAGGNVKEFKESIENGTPGQLMDDLTKDLYKIALILRQYNKPVIAAINGWAVGAGMNLALSCDILIASEQARFRQSFSKLALIPGFAGSILLSRQLTWQQASEMAFFGETYSAEEMKALGLVNKIVAPDQLMDTAREWAQKLAKGPTLTYARTKKLFFDALSTPLETHLENERQMQIKSAETKDYAIGVKALLDKEDPEFIGK